MKTPGHHIMHILNNESVVGNIWFEIRSRSVREAYLLDIIIFKEYRTEDSCASAEHQIW